MSAYHPFFVHFPIVLALLWPLLDALGLVTGRKDFGIAGVFCLVLGVIASVLSTVTGQAAYDAAVVAKVGPELLNTHRENADLVPWVFLLVLVFRLVSVQKFGKPAHAFALGLGVLAGVFVISVGRSGGVLVYEHGVGIKPLDQRVSGAELEGSSHGE